MSSIDCLHSIQERDWERLDEGTLRLAVIGLGWWTREQAIPAIEGSKFCETTVVVSSTEDKAQSVAARESSVRSALTYEQFIDGASSDEYDAVYICTPNSQHLPYARAAADHGKAVLCEKPMEASIERAEELVAVCERVPLMIAYRMQTDPEVRRMREIVSKGYIGQPIAVHGHMSQRILRDVSESANQWRLDPGLAGYGATVMDLGIYPINTARFVLDADPICVTAQMHSNDKVFADVPDQHAVFSIKFDNNTYAACTASQDAHFSGNFRLIGTSGELTLESTFLGQPSQRLVFRNEKKQEVVIDDGRRDLFKDEMTEEFDYFADRVIREESILPNGDHALTDMKTLAAVYKSAKNAVEVEI